MCELSTIWQYHTVPRIFLWKFFGRSFRWIGAFFNQKPLAVRRHTPKFNIDIRYQQWWCFKGIRVIPRFKRKEFSPSCKNQTPAWKKTTPPWKKMQGGVQAPAPVLCRGGCSPIFWGVSSLKNCHSFCSTDSSCLFATAMVTCIDDSSQLQLYTSIAMVHAASRNWPQYDYHRLTSGPCELQWHASPRCKQQEFSTLPCISSKQFLLGFASPAWHLMRNAPTSLFYVRWNAEWKAQDSQSVTTQQVDEGNTIHHEIKTRKQIIHIQCKFKNPRTSKNCPYAIICSFWSCVSFNLSHGSAWAKRTKELPDKVRCGSRRCCVIPPSKRPPPPSKALLVPFGSGCGRLRKPRWWAVTGQSLLLRRVWLGTQSGSCWGTRFTTPFSSTPSLEAPRLHLWLLWPCLLGRHQKAPGPGQSQPQQQYGRFGEAWVLKVLKWLVAPGSFFSSNPVASENATADFVRESTSKKNLGLSQPWGSSLIEIGQLEARF